MKLKREQANDLFVALGFPSCEGWDDKKMKIKLKKLPTIAATQVLEDDDLNTLMEDVCAAIEEGDGVSLIAGEKGAEEKPATKKKATKKKATKKKTTKKKAETAPKEKPAAAIKKKVAPPKKKAKTRMHCAGVILRDLRKSGNTLDELVEKVNSSYGNDNDKESRYCLRAGITIASAMGLVEWDGKEIVPAKA